MSGKKIKLADAQSTVRVVVATALAKALILGIENADEEGRPLTQVQQIDLATAHIMAYDEALEANEGMAVNNPIFDK